MTPKQPELYDVKYLGSTRYDAVENVACCMSGRSHHATCNMQHPIQHHRFPTILVEPQKQV